MHSLLVHAALTLLVPQLIEEIAQQIADRYVLIDEAPRIGDQLLEKALEGRYEKIQTPEKLAEVLTGDLRALSGDLHFAVEHDPALAARLIAEDAAHSRTLPELAPTADELERMRRANWGFRRAEILAGNVALIQISTFGDLAFAQPSASAAMAFAANADAVIFDVRGNPGGHGNTGGFLVSHFLPPAMELMSSFDRETGRTNVSRTLASVPGPRKLEAPLFVLIGPTTGSAAEAFAFTLQQVGRATIVGTRSVGAAQGGGWVPVGDGFVVFIPSFRPFNPHTGRSWEGTGVEPDVASSADRALEVAHAHAVAALDAKSTRQDLHWLLPLLELSAYGPAEHDLTGLDGHYAGIEITAVDGALEFLGASGILRNLTPLRDGTFLIEDDSVPPTGQARLRFVLGADGAVSGLELMIENGDVLPRARL
jgi:Peptidase family S41/N-terminal domain of Peptidase_S41 in eukaryotic IRBP